MKNYTVQLADFTFSINSSYIVGNSSNYSPTKAGTDFEISVNEQEILKEKNAIPSFLHDSTYEKKVIHRKISEMLPLHNAFLLHSACFDIGGEGVALAAHSGTGKSTHMLLLKQLLGDKMTIVNGDKPFIRFFDSLENAPEGTLAGVPYAYGTPWNGKEKLGCNMRTRLKHICFIERSEKNFVERIDPESAVNRIFNQVYMPQDPLAAANTIALTNRLISSCNLWTIHCNMDPEAARVSYNTLFPEA